MPSMGEAVWAAGVQAQRVGRRDDLGQDPGTHGVVADHPVLADLLAPGLELRLDQQHHVGAGTEQGRNHRENVPQRDERDVGGDDVEVPMVGRQVTWREVTGVDAFETGDACVGAQPPVHLVVTDVQRHHVAGATSQQHVGEASGRGADVQRLTAVHGDGKDVERVYQLERATADVRMIRLSHLQFGVVTHQVSGLGWGRGSGQADVAGQNQRPGPLARGGQPTLHEQRVEPDAGRAWGGHWRRVRVQSRMAGRWPERPARSSAAWPRAAQSRARCLLPSTPNSAG